MDSMGLGALGRLYVSPPHESRKNKSGKPGAFFHPKKMTAKTPRLPRNPPRFHHQNHHKALIFRKIP
jgi:hypothetical protein